MALRSSDIVGDPGVGSFIEDVLVYGSGHVPLMPGSPAINHGNDGACTPRDQLGEPRSGICDIGAVEFQGNHEDEDSKNKHHANEDDRHDGEHHDPPATHPQPVTWQLDNFFFSPEDGGGLWIGSFMFDAGSGKITEWNISVPGGSVFPQTVPSYTYTSSSSSAFASYLLTPAGNALIRFGTTPLPDPDSGSGPCDASQPQRCLLIETTPLPVAGGTVVVGQEEVVTEEIFTPVPFFSFIRTVDFDKQPQLSGNKHHTNEDDRHDGNQHGSKSD